MKRLAKGCGFTQQVLAPLMSLQLAVDFISENVHNLGMQQTEADMLGSSAESK